MKKYNVTVNGTVYEVEVEEVGGAYSAPVAAPAPAAAPAAKVAGEEVCAPMPGTVMSVKVSNGQAVKKGDVLLVLEAMKMENEIYAPCDGTVAAVSVSQGDAVESGKVLVVLN